MIDFEDSEYGVWDKAAYGIDVEFSSLNWNSKAKFRSNSRIYFSDLSDFFSGYKDLSAPSR